MRLLSVLPAFLFAVVLSSTSYPVAATHFDHDTAILLAGMCAVSYCKVDDIKAWSCPRCNNTFRPHTVYSGPNLANTVVVLDNKRDTTIVIFKGTDPLSWSQWAADLNMCRVTASDFCGNCLVHKGFLDLYNSIRDDVFRAFYDSYSNLPQVESGRKIIVSGHSLGAAISTLFTFYLTQTHGLKVTQFSFGSPRIGNKDFSEAYAKLAGAETYRVVHNKDIVPHLPPVLFGYYHEPLQVWCSTDDIRNCEKIYQEDDGGGFLHLSIPDHGSYLGVNYFDYLDLGKQQGCRY